MSKTHIGSEQVKTLGYTPPLYKQYNLGDVVKLKSLSGTFKIIQITGVGTLIYLKRKKLFSKSYSDKVIGPYWMDEIVGYRNY